MTLKTFQYQKKHNQKINPTGGKTRQPVIFIRWASKIMDTKNISNLLLKVGGILIIVLSVSNIHSYVSVYAQYTEKSVSLFLTTVIIPNILPFLLGMVLFLKPGKITNKIIQNTNNESDNPANISLLQIEQICLSTLGFYLLFQSSSDIVFHTANFVQAKASFAGRGVPPSNSLIFTPVYIATIAEFVFSLWLIFKAKGIVAFVNQIRTAENK